jgi:hypothetical protein
MRLRPCDSMSITKTNGSVGSVVSLHTACREIEHGNLSDAIRSMHCQPDRWGLLRSGVNPVFAMRIDHEPITCGKMDTLFRLLKVDCCPALQNENPFIPCLVVPESKGRGLAAGCDAFDAKGSRSAQLFELLTPCGVGKISKKGPV